VLKASLNTVREVGVGGLEGDNAEDDTVIEPDALSRFSSSLFCSWGGPQLATQIRRWLWKEMRTRQIAKTGPGALELWKVGEIYDLA
jgi:hypothetical protein